MFKKFFVLISLFFLCSCNLEYVDFHSKNKDFQESQIKYKQESTSFNFSKIEEKDLDFFITPDSKTKEKFLNLIKNAKTRILIEIYIFTDKDIIKAIEEAKKRWVLIEVIFEKNVYWAWNINKKTKDKFDKIWIKTFYANNDNYVYTHSKFAIIDDKYLISTANFSYSTFSTNREFLLIWEDKENLEIILQIFEADKIWEKKFITSDSLVISPFNSDERLKFLLENAKKSIYIYAETFSYQELKNILAKKKKEWIDIKIIIWNPEKIKSNIEDIDFFKQNKIEIVSPKKPFVHAKTILIDSEYFYIWSINFSENSIKNNRELGIIFKNKDIKNYFLEIFNADFKQKLGKNKK